MSSRRRPSLRQEQQAATRQRLLDAAHTAFSENGFVSTTVEQIAETAGASRATFYLHFKSKSDALAHTWLERDLPEVDDLFTAFDRAEDFSRPAIRSWLTRLVTYWEQHAGVGLSGNQALSLEPELAAAWMAGMTRVAGDMVNLQAWIGGSPAEAAGRILVRVIQLERVLYFWTSKIYPYDREHLIDALTDEWTSPGPGHDGP